MAAKQERAGLGDVAGQAGLTHAKVCQYYCLGTGEAPAAAAEWSEFGEIWCSFYHFLFDPATMVGGFVQCIFHSERLS